MRMWAVLVAAVLVTAACGDAGDAADPTDPGATTAPAGPVAAGLGAGEIPRCADVPRLAAPADRYRDAPVYVANEMPVEAVQRWARGKPGFEGLWIDRDHAGWITVAFSSGANERQAELEAGFPGDGVVAIAVDWTAAGLDDLQRRLGEQLSPLFPFSSWTAIDQGVVGVHVGVLHPDRVAAVEERFAGEPLCLEGTPVEDAPAPGPQPPGGEGWRLLADQPGVGESYRTGIAADPEAYRLLWERIGLAGEPPPVDFERDVVIWFGAVFGSSCPDLRLDAVVVDHERALVYADIVLVDPPAACTADANARAYLVAVDRALLPARPFAIQLGPDDPPPGAPEERTLVDADLTVPGAAAPPGAIGPDPALPEPWFVESGDVVEPGFAVPYRLYVHCGIGWLGELNGLWWHTDPVVPDHVPLAWQALETEEQTIEVSLLLDTGPPPVIVASAAGHDVTYVPATTPPPGCD